MFTQMIQITSLYKCIGMATLVDYFVDLIDAEYIGKAMDIDFILNIINKMGSGETHRLWLILLHTWIPDTPRLKTG